MAGGESAVVTYNSDIVDAETTQSPKVERFSNVQILNKRRKKSRGLVPLPPTRNTCMGNASNISRSCTLLTHRSLHLHSCMGSHGLGNSLGHVVSVARATIPAAGGGGSIVPPGPSGATTNAMT